MPPIVGTDRLRRAALIVWTSVGVLVLLATAIFLASQVRVIWLPIAFAAGLVFLLEPAVAAMERARIARPIAVFIAFIALIALVLATIALVYPILREQADQLVSQLPDIYTQVIEWAKDTGTRLGIDVEHFLTQDAIEEWLNDPANQETIQNLLIGFGAGAGALIPVPAAPASCIDAGPLRLVTLRCNEWRGRETIGDMRDKDRELERVLSTHAAAGRCRFGPQGRPRGLPLEDWGLLVAGHRRADLRYGSWRRCTERRSRLPTASSTATPRRWRRSSEPVVATSAAAARFAGSSVISATGVPCCRRSWQSNRRRRMPRSRSARRR